MRSHHPEDSSDLPLHQGVSRSKGRAEGTDKRQDHDHHELLQREEHTQLLLKNQRLLDRHRVPHDHANHDACHAACEHKHHCLVEVQQLDADLGEPDRAENANFLGLLVKIGGHVGWEREEAKEHGRDDDRIKDLVHDFRYFIGCGVISTWDEFLWAIAESDTTV